MKKIHIQLLLILLLFPVLSFSQSMIIDQNGKLLIDGQNGVGIHTPQININSGETSYGGGNGALVLCNTNRTNNNWLRFSFLTTLTNGNQLDLANIGVQYNSHTAGQQVGSLHFFTDVYNVWKPRFSIVPMGTNGNNTQFEFNPEGNKLVINSSGIFPASANTLNLGSSGQQFNCIYAYKLYSNGSSVVVSDYREKNNIEELSEDAIAKVCRLRAISYKLNGENGRMQFSAAAQERSEYDEYGRRIHNNAEEAAEKEKQEQHRLTENNQTYFGLIAQEVKEVFPEIVEYDSVTDRWSKIKKIKRIKG